MRLTSWSVQPWKSMAAPWLASHEQYQQVLKEKI